MKRGVASTCLSFALAVTAALGVACGSETTSDGGSPDASSTGSGGQGGATGSGGSAGSGQGGNPLTDGAVGTGGATPDGPMVACYDDGGKGLAAAARHCAMDSDCQVGIAQTCCGADNALGIAKAQAQA